jgi:hypothetical protein
MCTISANNLLFAEIVHIMKLILFLYEGLEGKLRRITYGFL